MAHLHPAPRRKLKIQSMVQIPPGNGKQNLSRRKGRRKSSKSWFADFCVTKGDIHTSKLECIKKDSPL